MTESGKILSRTEGMLYLCATPIGNLADITDRVVRTLREVDLIACEDTRNSRKLFSHLDIHTPFTAYHHHNRHDKARELVRQLKEGRHIALITDAGMPVISDPGEELVRLCRKEGIRVTALPGACAFVTALASSGIAAGRFVFEGFLPGDNRKKERARILKQLAREERTIILYEAPHHLKKTLADLCAVMPEREIALCRELTKKFEEVTLSTVEEAMRDADVHEPRGEYVLVIAGTLQAAQTQGTAEDFTIVARENDASGNAPVAANIAMENNISGTADAAAAVDAYNGDLRIADMTGEEVLQVLLMQLDVASHVAFYEAKGMERKEAMRAAAKDRGVSRREIYQNLLES